MSFRMIPAACAALLACSLVSHAAAQGYPSRPIRLIVPFPPGGSNDIVARHAAAHLTERIGRQVVVDNRAGGGGIIGTGIVASAQPDGYTLLLVSVAFALNATLHKLPYDIVSSFSRVALLGSGPNVLVVHPALAATSVKELVTLAKAKPGGLHYASAGVGSFQHFGTELFRILTGAPLVHVPYKGGGSQMVDLMSGQVDLAFYSVIQALPHIRSGKMRALGTGGARRPAALAELPTLAEAGVPGYEASNWWGIVAPARTPEAALDRLHRELSAIMALPDTQKRFAAEGAEPVVTSREAFGKLIVAERTKWERVTREAGIRAE